MTRLDPSPQSIRRIQPSEPTRWISIGGALRSGTHASFQGHAEFCSLRELLRETHIPSNAAKYFEACVQRFAEDERCSRVHTKYVNSRDFRPLSEEVLQQQALLDVLFHQPGQSGFMDVNAPGAKAKGYLQAGAGAIFASIASPDSLELTKAMKLRQFLTGSLRSK